MNGTYAFVYCGYMGPGLGIFRVAGSDLVGSDLAGGRYHGHLTQNPDTNKISISFDMFVPAGLQLVQGTSPQDLAYTKRASIVVPADFGDGSPFEVYVPPGPVTLMVKRISDDFSAWADGVTVNITPISAKQSS